MSQAPTAQTSQAPTKNFYILPYETPVPSNATDYWYVIWESGKRAVWSSHFLPRGDKCGALVVASSIKLEGHQPLNQPPTISSPPWLLCVPISDCFSLGPQVASLKTDNSHGCDADLNVALETPGGRCKKHQGI